MAAREAVEGRLIGVVLAQDGDPAFAGVGQGALGLGDVQILEAAAVEAVAHQLDGADGRRNDLGADPLGLGGRGGEPCREPGDVSVTGKPGCVDVG